MVKTMTAGLRANCYDSHVGPNETTYEVAVIVQADVSIACAGAVAMLRAASRAVTAAGVAVGRYHAAPVRIDVLETGEVVVWETARTEA